MSARKAIREFCLSCTLNSYKEISACPSTDCAIWPYREGLTLKGESKQKAIRLKCVDCLQNILTVRCKEKKCPLFPYRQGHRPVKEDHVKKTIAPELLAKMKAGLVRKRLIGSDEKSKK